MRFWFVEFSVSQKCSCLIFADLFENHFISFQFHFTCAYISCNIRSFRQKKRTVLKLTGSLSFLFFFFSLLYLYPRILLFCSHFTSSDFCSISIFLSLVSFSKWKEEETRKIECVCVCVCCSLLLIHAFQSSIII